jgi:hypothetical protein
MRLFVMIRDIQFLLEQQAALAAFGALALRETSLLRILNEAARVCAIPLLTFP